MKKNNSITSKQEYCIYCKRPINKVETVLQSHRECYYAIIEYQKKLKKLQNRNAMHDFHNRFIHAINSLLITVARAFYYPIRDLWLLSNSIAIWAKASFTHGINSIRTNFFSLYHNKIQTHDFKIVWLGLNDSGKSTLIKRLTTGSFVDTQRTLGLNFDTISFEEKNFFFWDLGGMEAFRTALWKNFLIGSQGIVYVIDSADKNRIIEAKQELWNYVFNNSYLKSIPTLILANKQDLNNVFTVDEIVDTLELYRVTDRLVALYPTSAVSNQNLNAAFEWLRNNILL